MDKFKDFSKILSLTEIKKKLEDKKLYTVAEKTGLSYPTLAKLATGEKSNYTLETLLTISEYLKNSESTEAHTSS